MEPFVTRYVEQVSDHTMSTIDVELLNDGTLIISDLLEEVDGSNGCRSLIKVKLNEGDIMRLGDKLHQLAYRQALNVPTTPPKKPTLGLHLKQDK